MSVQEERSPERLFPPGSLARMIGERRGTIAVAAGRAILMQLAHPSVAAGIDEHSTFKRDPLGRTIRTAEAFRHFFWRTRAEVDEIVPKIRAQHARVRGDGYFAEDPALLLWVHATTIDSLMVVFSRSVRPLSTAERASYYEDAKIIAELLGCPRERQPDDIASFDEYIASMSNELRASDVGRSLARDFLFYPVRTWATPIAASFRLLVCGYTPRRIRDDLGVPWRAHHRVAWSAVDAARVPIRARRRRRRWTDPATTWRDGVCADCGDVGIVGGPIGRCGACSRRLGDARMARLERFGRAMGLQRRS